MKKFCPSCGAETKKFYERVCIKCHLKKTKILEAPKQIKIVYCNCGHVKINERWIKFSSLKNEITGAIKKVLRVDENAKLNIIIPEIENKGKIKVNLTASVGSIKENQEVYVILNKQLCGNCTKERGGYYETILQVRGEKTRWEKTKNFIIREIQRLNERGAFISKIEQKKEGIDICVGSKKVASKAIKELKKVCNFNIKRSYKIYGEKKGRTMFRETILIKLER